MFELPEFTTLAEQISETLQGKIIQSGRLGNKPHKWETPLRKTFFSKHSFIPGILLTIWTKAKSENCIKQYSKQCVRRLKREAAMMNMTSTISQVDMCASFGRGMLLLL